MKKEEPVNWFLVTAVALICGVSLTLFFVNRNRTAINADVAVDTSLADSSDLDLFNDCDYYEEVAAQFIANLPSDKELIAKLIDDKNHHIIYLERSSAPSCYIYDLETLTTAVLFSGQYGFYCGTKLLMTAEITDWKRLGNTVIFISGNRAPDANYSNAALVFTLELYTHDLEYVDFGSRAYFADSTRLVVFKTRELPSSLPFDNSTYEEFPITYQLTVND